MDNIRIEVLLQEVINRQASDLHIQVGTAPMLRVDGQLVESNNSAVLDIKSARALIDSILDDEQRQVFAKDKELDFSFSYGDIARFRVNVFHERGNVAAALRLIPHDIPTLQALGLPPIVETFANFPRGLVLVTGLTGTGKSTTLASIINQINEDRTARIVTIEDPIEFTHLPKRSIVAQREVHYDTYSFSTALRSVMREDPDVIMIGELRDLESINAALAIAESGHLVFATLSTNSAAGSIDRIVNSYPAHQQQQVKSQLANSLQAICSQRLVPAIGGGRVCVAEIMLATPSIRNIIREGRSNQLNTAIQMGQRAGMQSVDQTLANLIRSGTVTYDEAQNYALDLENLSKLTRG